MIHCGLFGHVDSGKTAIARVLSEVVSTAGLDAHPQARDRGISIDLGFTSFTLDGAMIALVDAPGHADLIRSVVASASIIDVALVVIDAVNGPELQTGEHMIILESLNIKHVLFVLNKIDMIDEDAVAARVRATRSFIDASGHAFTGAPVVAVSAKTRTGFDALARALREVIAGVDTTRDVSGSFLMTFDHHFPVKGFGTVLTGTVLTGTVRAGDTLEIAPPGMTGKVKSIQVFKESVTTASAGDRAGIAIAGIDDKRLFRGCVLATPGTITNARDVIIDGFTTSFFKHPLAFKSHVHVSAGMLTVPATFLPYRREGELLYPVDVVAPRSGAFVAWLHLHEPVPCKAGFTVLLSRLDLPPVELRVAGRGIVREVLVAPPVLHVVKHKTGRVKDGTKGIVEGLAGSHQGAVRLAGREIDIIAPGGVDEILARGRILEPFGTKGNVRVALDPAGVAVPAGAVARMAVVKVLRVTT